MEYIITSPSSLVINNFYLNMACRNGHHTRVQSTCSHFMYSTISALVLQIFESWHTCLMYDEIIITN